MPTIALTNKQKADASAKRLTRTIREEMRSQKKSQKYMAEQLNMTQQAFSHDLNNMTLTIKQLSLVMMDLGLAMKGEKDEQI